MVDVELGADGGRLHFFTMLASRIALDGIKASAIQLDNGSNEVEYLKQTLITLGRSKSKLKTHKTFSF